MGEKSREGNGGEGLVYHWGVDQAPAKIFALILMPSIEERPNGLPEIKLPALKFSRNHPVRPRLSAMGLKEIPDACGFQTPLAMRRPFLRVLGITAGEYGAAKPDRNG